jgi:hypothetical protein
MIIIIRRTDVLNSIFHCIAFLFCVIVFYFSPYIWASLHRSIFVNFYGYVMTEQNVVALTLNLLYLDVLWILCIHTDNSLCLSIFSVLFLCFSFVKVLCSKINVYGDSNRNLSFVIEYPKNVALIIILNVS